MPNTSYSELPIETLYQLLTATIKELLFALDTNQDDGIGYKSKRKQVEILLTEIEKKTASRRLAKK